MLIQNANSDGRNSKENQRKFKAESKAIQREINGHPKEIKANQRKFKG